MILSKKDIPFEDVMKLSREKDEYNSSAKDTKLRNKYPFQTMIKYNIVEDIKKPTRCVGFTKDFKIFLRNNNLTSRSKDFLTDEDIINFITSIHIEDTKLVFVRSIINSLLSKLSIARVIIVNNKSLIEYKDILTELRDEKIINNIDLCITFEFKKFIKENIDQMFKFESLTQVENILNNYKKWLENIKEIHYENNFLTDEELNSVDKVIDDTSELCRKFMKYHLHYEEFCDLIENDKITHSLVNEYILDNLDKIFKSKVLDQDSIGILHSFIKAHILGDDNLRSIPTNELIDYKLVISPPPKWLINTCLIDSSLSIDEIMRKNISLSNISEYRWIGLNNSLFDYNPLKELKDVDINQYNKFKSEKLDTATSNLFCTIFGDIIHYKYLKEFKIKDTCKNSKFYHNLYREIITHMKDNNYINQYGNRFYLSNAVISYISYLGDRCTIDDIIYNFPQLKTSKLELSDEVNGKLLLNIVESNNMNSYGSYRNKLCKYDILAWQCCHKNMYSYKPTIIYKVTDPFILFAMENDKEVKDTTVIDIYKFLYKKEYEDKERLKKKKEILFSTNLYTYSDIPEGIKEPKIGKEIPVNIDIFEIIKLKEEYRYLINNGYVNLEQGLLSLETRIWDKFHYEVSNTLLKYGIIDTLYVKNAFGSHKKVWFSNRFIKFMKKHFPLHTEINITDFIFFILGDDDYDYNKILSNYHSIVGEAERSNIIEVVINEGIKLSLAYKSFKKQIYNDEGDDRVLSKVFMTYDTSKIKLENHRIIRTVDKDLETLFYWAPNKNNIKPDFVCMKNKDIFILDESLNEFKKHNSINEDKLSNETVYRYMFDKESNIKINKKLKEMHENITENYTSLLNVVNRINSVTSLLTEFVDEKEEDKELENEFLKLPILMDIDSNIPKLIQYGVVYPIKTRGKYGRKNSKNHTYGVYWTDELINFIKEKFNKDVTDLDTKIEFRELYSFIDFKNNK